MHTGVILKVLALRGFGFIEPSAAGPDLFFFHKSLQPPLEFDEQLCGRRVTFDLADGRDGKPKAVNVRPAD